MKEADTIAGSLTKHEQIIRYIKSLDINARVSVRQIAKNLAVSEGTAYRAIKEAEAQGLVSSIPKVGTIRIQAESEKTIKELTLKEISLALEGEPLTGSGNLDTVPSRFIIGCNSLELMKKALDKDVLLFVGDLPELQSAAIKKGAHLVVAGALRVNPAIKQAANEKNRVIISCPYDVFEAVTMLNKALFDRLTSKELLRVSDIMVKDPYFLQGDNIVEDWHRLSQETGYSRFPVVDHDGVVIGIVTAMDVAGMDRKASILSVMTKDVLKVDSRTLVTHLSRILLWEGFELVPIVEEGRLIGVVSRQDILQAFQQMQKQPHVGETVDNLVMSGFKLEKWDEGTKISGEITPFMIDEHQTASPGVLVTIASTLAYVAVRKQLRLNTYMNSLTIYHMEPMEIGGRVEAYARIIRYEKKNCVTDINLYCNGKLKAKCLIALRVVR